MEQCLFPWQHCQDSMKAILGLSKEITMIHWEWPFLFIQVLCGDYLCSVRIVVRVLRCVERWPTLNRFFDLLFFYWLSSESNEPSLDLLDENMPPNLHNSLFPWLYTFHGVISATVDLIQYINTNVTKNWYYRLIKLSFKCSPPPPPNCLSWWPTKLYCHFVHWKWH